MAIESKNLLTVVKAYARANGYPLDYSEVWESLAEAQNYLSNPTAYAGQTIKVKIDGKFKNYTLQPEGGNLVLEEVGAVKASDLKQYVQIVTALPESGQEQGVLYINTTDSTGSIYTGTEFTPVFKNVEVEIGKVKAELEAEIATKAPIDNPTFTGKVTLAADPTSDLEAVTKRYVDALITKLTSNATPGIVNSSSPLPTEGYTAGEMFRVSEAGTYAGAVCEVGDLIIVLRDHVAETASDDDFMVVQANISGAVTGPEFATNLNIAIFDGATGKVIKDSEVSVASLNDAIAKAHEHANKDVLDSYDKTQTELLAATQEQVNTAKTALEEAIAGKADKATTLEGYGITDAYNKTEIDGKLQTITDNLNTKLDGAAVDAKIATAKEETLREAATAASEALEARIGGIEESTTLKEYIDTAIGSGGVSTAEAIAAAKEEAINTSKAYTDSKLQIIEF